MISKIKLLLQSKWLWFGIAAVIYSLFVLWVENYWLFLGLLIVFDVYITKKVRWAFWKPRKGQKGVRHKTLEWVDAIIFAVVAATIIRLFFIEAYTIPTSSMEKTMMVGDFLFVSKTAYGPKLPNTPLSLPLVHNTLPMTSHTPSYLEWIKRPYHRLRGFGKVKRDDIVVFNFPEGDTVAAERSNESYYGLVRQYGRAKVWQNYTIIVHPLDKCENYIKRCVAVPGDSLKVVNGQLWVNNVPQDTFPNMQKTYYVQTTGTLINNRIFEKIGIPKADRIYNAQYSVYELPLTTAQLSAIQQLPNVHATMPHNNIDPGAYLQRVFPQVAGFEWTEDNYGPIWVPKKGSSVVLDSASLPLYRRIIAVYEHNKLEETPDGIFINGKQTDTYTFKMNYYWMMGDNRHNSLDSRFWGFVPEDHVVGKASMVWMSLDPDKKFPMNIRWKRLLKVMK